MFDDQAFASWPLILSGAALFAMLFTLLMMLADLLFDGTFEVTRGAISIGGAAFAGYVVAALIRRHNPSDGEY